jgi:hypothetical protein
VPTIAETDDRRLASTPKCSPWAYSAAALPSPSPCQLKRALNEQLVAVEMCLVLDVVDAGLAYEVRKPLRVQLSISSNIRLAAVSAEHVPGRIADDGVEPRDLKRVASLVAEDFGKRQRPMEETVLQGQR